MTQSHKVLILTLAASLAAGGGCRAGDVRNNVAGKAKSFKVYCVNDKLQVDERPREEITMVRGKNCIKSEHVSQKAAHAEASRLGGIGHGCLCGQPSPPS